MDQFHIEAITSSSLSPSIEDVVGFEVTQLKIDDDEFLAKQFEKLPEILRD